MRLLDRFSTLLRADAHGMIDALEDRSLVLRQSLREAEAELFRKRSRLELLEAEADDLRADRERLAEDERSLDADTDLALGGERPDLARHAVRRLLAVRRTSASVIDRLDANRREREELAERLREQEERFGELERRVRGRLADSGDATVDRPPIWAISDEEVELELLRRSHEGRGATS